MNIIKHRKIFYIISAALAGLSVGAVLFFGLTLGIDFKGGSITEVSYEVRPEKALVEERIAKLPIGAVSLQASGEHNFILKTRHLLEAERLAVLDGLSLGGVEVMKIERFNSIGPTIGKELRSKAVFAIIAVLLSITLFIAYVFRKVSKPVSSFKYGVIALIALAHDIFIPFGLYAVLGQFFLVEVDILFVMALLAILGFSVHDTIVVFDRVRENLKANEDARVREKFEDTVGKSLNQTIVRSINTSMTVIIVLIFLFIFGGESTKWFTLTLLSGMIAGTYSSIFLATPLLVSVNNWQEAHPSKQDKK